MPERHLRQHGGEHGVQPVFKPERSASRRDRAVPGRHIQLLAEPVGNLFEPWRGRGVALSARSNRGPCR